MRIEFRKLTRNGRNTNFISLTGSETVAISAIAQEICVELGSLIEDIKRLPDNLRVLMYLWDNHAKPYIKKIENDTEKSSSFRQMFLVFRDGDSTYNEAKDGSIKNPSDYLGRELTRYPYGVALAINLGAVYQSWQVDLKQGPLILTPELDQSQWHKCRASNSIARRDSEKANRYKAAVQKLAPYLDKMEHLIDKYEEAAQNWQTDAKGGQPYLQGLAALNLIERMTDIYSRQSAGAQATNALAKELMEHCGGLVQRSLLAAVRRVLKEMAALYFDSGLAKALWEYLKLWDPSDHYYFHTVVANSVDAPRKRKGRSNDFDDRFFQAVDNLTRYISADADTAEAVAKEANRAAAKVTPLVMELAKQGKLGSNVPLQQLLDRGEKSLADLQGGGDTGVLSVFVTWSGYAGSWLGTMEGPPTVAGLAALNFAKSKNFISFLERDTLLKFVALIGVDKTRIAVINELVQRGGQDDLKTARDLYIRSSWRSRTIFVAFTLLGTAALIYHVDALVQKLKDDGDQHKFDSELIKLILFVTSDVTNLGLVALTFKYNRDLEAFLASNMKASTQALADRITAMDAGGWRVATVGVFYKGVTVLGVILTLWDLGAQWSSTDTFEKAVMFGTVAASLGMCLGSFGITGWMGPVGLVVTVVLGLVMVVYQYFKSGFEQTLRGLLDGFGDTLLFKDNLYYPVHKEQIFIILTNAKTLEDLRDELSKSIANSKWRNPDLGYAVEYQRAGITDESLAKIYDMDLAEIKEIIKNEWYALDKYHARTASARIELLTPESGIKLVVGVQSSVRVAVYNGDNVGYAFLEPDPQWCDGDPDQYLAEDVANPLEPQAAGSYNVEKKSVMLYAEPQRTKYVSYFVGNLRILALPPGKVARFYIKTPNANTKWIDGRPDGWKAQLLVDFPVTA